MLKKKIDSIRVNFTNPSNKRDMRSGLKTSNFLKIIYKKRSK